mmetsp:Transcript_21892/g.53649  ORF Transcript_21892/g.53649 Transcript_21892/m.53649 type:complete len:233 (+) Transcript_21892:291-989(+)
MQCAGCLACRMAMPCIESTHGVACLSAWLRGLRAVGVELLWLRWMDAGRLCDLIQKYRLSVYVCLHCVRCGVHPPQIKKRSQRHTDLRHTKHTEERTNMARLAHGFPSRHTADTDAVPAMDMSVQLTIYPSLPPLNTPTNAAPPAVHVLTAVTHSLTDVHSCTVHVHSRTRPCLALTLVHSFSAPLIHPQVDGRTDFRLSVAVASHGRLKPSTCAHVRPSVRLGCLVLDTAV